MRSVISKNIPTTMIAVSTATGIPRMLPVPKYRRAGGIF